MTDELFKLLVAQELIDWPDIKYALENNSKLPDPLSRDVLISYADQRLLILDVDSKGFAEIADLAVNCPHTREDMLGAVSVICSQLNDCDDTTAEKKWRVAELECLLQGLDDDPVYALVQLSTFWAKWGWPPDTPNSVGAGDVSNNSYGSPEHFKVVLAEHRAWLKEELSRLQHGRPS